MVPTACRSFTIISMMLVGQAASAASAEQSDVVVYGGTSAGIAAAVQAARSGRSVILIEPTGHLGGMTSGGLGATDHGKKDTIGGISREFYQRVKRHYSVDGNWKRQKRAEYASYNDDPDTMWHFEPHVAEQIFNDLSREAGVNVIGGQRLDLKRGVRKTGARITSIMMESGQSYAAKVFVDATYEGDLMAAAGVSYAVGRESNAVYGEQFNGVQSHLGDSYNFYSPVSAYVVAGDRSSGLLPGVQPLPGPDGEGDHRIMGYNFRLCTSDDPDNMRPWTKPENYDERDFEMVLRAFDHGYASAPWSGKAMPNRKYDANSGGFIGSDWFGMNYAFPDGDYATREKYIEAHRYYMRGLAWTIVSNPRVPKTVKKSMQRRGLAKDEFVDNDNWPYIPYIREARRMVSDYVMTEHDALWARRAPDSIGLANYTLDSHHVQRHVDAKGNIRNEGNVLVPISGPYPVSLRSVMPKADQCDNLLVPVCLAASHITYGSIRMEPVYMVLGQSVGAAAAMAAETNVTVQQVKYEDLRKRLVNLKQVLDYSGRSTRADAVAAADLQGIVVDDRQAVIAGYWGRGVGGKFVLPYVLGGDGKRKIRTWRNGKVEMLPMTITYEAKLPASAAYEVRMSYTPNAGRASNAAVAVSHAAGTEQLQVNQRETPPIDGMFVSLGTFQFDGSKPARVVISTGDADGDVCADAVQFIRSAK